MTTNEVTPDLVVQPDEFDLLPVRVGDALGKKSEGPATARPFIRIIGGKWTLAERLMDCMPRVISRYAEPFAGGAAVFWKLRTTGRLPYAAPAVLSDFDPDLIRLYEEVKANPEGLLARLNAQYGADYSHDPETTYYAVRSAWNAGHRTCEAHLFLRAGCFNGVWRQNSSGGMNSPWRKDKLALPPLQRLKACQAALVNTTLVAADFRTLFVRRPATGLAIYCDPPYYGGETRYTAGGFSEADQQDLVQRCAKWESDGAHVVYSNHDLAFVRAQLRAHWPTAQIRTYQHKRSVNSDGAKRGGVRELIAFTPLDRGP